jgi:hypothetical protein
MCYDIIVRAQPERHGGMPRTGRFLRSVQVKSTRSACKNIIRGSAFWLYICACFSGMEGRVL